MWLRVFGKGDMAVGLGSEEAKKKNGMRPVGCGSSTSFGLEVLRRARRLEVRDQEEINMRGWRLEIGRQRGKARKLRRI
ncbi:hypothetical protein MA16_Dca005640 [Dendrobium catenatum]|uniref:Uncharacterized protein n=1 Tax=Dendrobium catenatum TaxID=906689 RepID=A0A2I0WQ79_9ASPA|nr:hypothetical protein MA16_Dca005640 [Dendrobium catenatum]